MTIRWLFLVLLSSSSVYAVEVQNQSNEIEDIGQMEEWRLTDNNSGSFGRNQAPEQQDSFQFFMNRWKREESDPDVLPESGPPPVCRVPDGHYLPIDLFSLDACARCYRYIPDQPSFFHRYTKWNHTVVTLRVEPFGVSYNVTFLVNRHENLTVSFTFRPHS